MSNDNNRDWLGAAIGGVTGLASGALNSIGIGSENRKNRSFQREMFNQQKRYQSQQMKAAANYNSPLAVRSRFEEAGLNPYHFMSSMGGGEVGYSSAPSPSVPSSIDPRLGEGLSRGLQSMSSFIQFEGQRQAIDNMEAERYLKQQEALLKMAQAINTSTQTDRSKFDLQFVKDNNKWIAGALKQNVLKMQADTRFQLDENQRRAVMNTQNLQESVQRILNMEIGRVKTKQEIVNLKSALKGIKKDNILKDMNIKLMKDGIYPNSPWYYKFLTSVLQALGEKYKIPSLGGSTNAIGKSLFFGDGKGNSGRPQKRLQMPGSRSKSWRLRHLFK